MEIQQAAALAEVCDLRILLVFIRNINVILSKFHSFLAFVCRHDATNPARRRLTVVENSGALWRISLT